MMTYLVSMMISLQPVTMEGRFKQTKEPPLLGLQGVYLVAGTESGKDYKGVTIIRQYDNDAVYMVNVTGKVIVEGIGIRTGDSLAVSWSNGKAHGVTLYRITGRTLTGRWSTSGPIHREQLTFLGELPED